MSKVVKGLDGRYYKPCSKCGKEQSYLRKTYAEESLRLAKLCKSCSNKEVENCHRGWHRGVRISWFNKFKTSAEVRGISWELSLDDVADLLKEQESLCALSGVEITFPETGHPQKAPASIDRINSKLGYTRENSQLLTREVNMMKQSYTQERFIAICTLVADKSKW